MSTAKLTYYKVGALNSFQDPFKPEELFMEKEPKSRLPVDRVPKVSVEKVPKSRLHLAKKVPAWWEQVTVSFTFTRLSSSPTFFLLFLFPTFSYLFSDNYFYFFYNKIPKQFLLSGNARVAGECTIYPTVSGGLEVPFTPALKYFKNFWFILFLSLLFPTLMN